MHLIINIYIISILIGLVEMGSHAVFELRKNKRLSHRQPGYKIWLSVHVFGCPNVATVDFTAGASKFMVVRQTTLISIFGCLDTFFGCPERMDNQNFERWSYDMCHFY